MLFSSMPWPRAAEATALALLASLTGSALAQGNNAPVGSPNLDLSNLGRVALAGDFDAISLYSYENESESPYTTNGSQALLSANQNGVFSTNVDSDGHVLAACPFVTSDNTLQGIVVGGNFTMMGGNALQAVALWNPNTPKYVAPLTGLSGKVYAVHCDRTNNRVYVGGEFTGANSTNAIVWMGNGGWTNMPFEGFSGAVNAISNNPDNNNVVFAGKFRMLGNVTDNSTTTTEIPSLIVNIGGGTAGDGGSTISAAESSTDPLFSNPASIVCKTSPSDGPNNTWLAQDNTRATWKVLSPYGYEPTRLRLYNTHYQGRGTKSWRFTAFPENGIMNFTYVDPVTGQNSTCDAECPLSNDTSIQYQDFNFVNVIGMTGFQIDAYDWYGAGAGLDGVMLTQNANYVYAVPEFNSPNCSNASYPASSTHTGPWRQTPSGQSISDYETADLQGPGVNSESASLTFYPTIEQAGMYSVDVFTPGCQPQGNCSMRGIANVTGGFSRTGSAATPTQISQTNQFEKYDNFYNGHVDLPSGDFRPYVRIQPLDDQNDSMQLVALRVRFNLLSADGNSSSTSSSSSSSTSSNSSSHSSVLLNGLFEIDPNNATVETNFNNSAINRAGQNLSADAEITTMANANNALYIAGNFSTDSFSNIFSFKSSESNSLAQGGLNGRVASMLSWGNLLFIGGNFTNTRAGQTPLAQNVAVYDTTLNTWSPLGGGVNGLVTSIVPLELMINGQMQSCITVNGLFTQVLAGPNSNGFNATDGLAIWLPAYNVWMQNLNSSIPAIRGQLTYAVNYTASSGNGTLYAGTISSQGMAIQDVISLTSSSGNATIESLGLQEPQVAASGNKVANKVVTTNGTQMTLSGAVTGLFVTDNGRNMSVIAGNFQTNATNGTAISNLVFINTASNGSNTVTGIASGINTTSTFLALARDDNTLYAGGAVSGGVMGQNVSGMIVWDLSSGNFAQQQPAPLGPSDSQVNTLTYDSTAHAVYAGGTFTSAGVMTCPGLCMWSNGQWSQPGRGFAGVVNTLMWQGNTRLLVAGNFTNGGNKTVLASYDTTNQAWSTPDNVNQVPGPVTVLTPANTDNSQYWLAGTATNGSAYLMKSDGTNFFAVPPQFGPGTTIRGLSVLSLTQSHATTSLLDGSFAVLVTGAINIPNFGNASAVLFNGTTLTPFILSNSGNGPGSMSQVFSERSQDFATGGSHLALGFVVLIALAIALALIFLIVVAGVLLERYRRRSEGYRPAPQNYVEKTANMGRIPPDQLLGSLSRGNEGPRI